MTGRRFYGQPIDPPEHIEPMIIRNLCKDDAAAYRALMLEGYTIAADAFTSAAEERATESLAWWERRIQDPNGLSLVFGAFENRHLVGSVAVEYSARAKTRHKAMIVGMYVSVVNRKRGVGLALLKELIDQTRARKGGTMVTLTVTEGNEPATRLYESIGFKQFGVEPMAVFTGTKYISKVHMYLILT